MDNLDLPTIASSQTQKEATSNDADAQLSSALADIKSLDFTSGDVTASLADFQNYMGFLCTNVGAPQNLTFPAKKRALFYVKNPSASTITVKVGSTSVALLTATAACFSQDGTANGLTRLVFS